jgi:hypothetical protein
LSTWAQILFPAAGSVMPTLPALSILAWMPLLQNCAMFGLEFEPGWIEPHPSRMTRKSDAAG